MLDSQTHLQGQNKTTAGITDSDAINGEDPFELRCRCRPESKSPNT
jgi:hypothetical protein